MNRKLLKESIIISLKDNDEIVDLITDEYEDKASQAGNDFSREEFKKEYYEIMKELK